MLYSPEAEAYSERYCYCCNCEHWYSLVVRPVSLVFGLVGVDWVTIQTCLLFDKTNCRALLTRGSRLHVRVFAGYADASRRCICECWIYGRRIMFAAIQISVTRSFWKLHKPSFKLLVVHKNGSGHIQDKLARAGLDKPES